MSDHHHASPAPQRPATPVYHAGMHCQQCGGTNFWVRSLTAECGNSRCGAAYAIFAATRPTAPLPEKTAHAAAQSL